MIDEGLDQTLLAKDVPSLCHQVCVVIRPPVYERLGYPDSSDSDQSG